MQTGSADIVPFSKAENNTLQVLLDEFKLSQSGMDTKLKVSFDANTDTIRRREAKKGILSELRGSKQDLDN